MNECLSESLIVVANSGLYWSPSKEELYIQVYIIASTCIRKYPNSKGEMYGFFLFNKWMIVYS